MAALKFIKISKEECKKCLKENPDYIILEPGMLGAKVHFVCSDCAKKIKEKEETSKNILDWAK